MSAEETCCHRTLFVCLMCVVFELTIICDFLTLCHRRSIRGDTSELQALTITCDRQTFLLGNLNANQAMTTTASLTSAQRKSELRANVLALAEACPVENCNPTDCPLYQLRQKKYTARLAWFNALSEDDLAYLAAYHDVCLNLKLAQKVAEENFFPET